MKKVKDYLLMIMTILLAISVTGYGFINNYVNASSESEKVSGIFRGSAEGMASEIIVDVVLNNGVIESVDIVDEDDTVFIADKVYETLPDKIVEHQSVGVDFVSGASFTSLGVMNAVKDAIDSAGLDTEPYTERIEFSYEPVENQEYDVVIVGGGTSGLTAAISLMTEDDYSKSDETLNVLLLDKLAYTGGALRVSDGRVIFWNNTPYNEVTNTETTDEEFIAYVKERDEKGYLVEPLLEKVLAYTPTVVKGLLNRGLYMPAENAKAALIGNDEEANLSFANFTIRNPYTGVSSDRPEEDINYGSNAGSPWTAQSLENAAKLAGAEIRTNAKVESLIIEDDKVLGVHVKDKNNYTEYDVMADKVIVATGIIGTDRANLEKWGDEEALKAVHFGSAGNQGDGHAWAEELGGEIFFGERSHYKLGFNEKLGHYGESNALLDQNTANLWVNQDGVRFINENESRNTTNAAVRDQEGNKAYGIVDSNAEYLEHMEFLMDRGVAWQADSLEELAEQIKVPYEQLEVTLSTYNEAYNDGEDDQEFGTAHEFMSPVQEGPFYAFQIRSLLNATDSSVKVDENFMLDRGDGTTVEDLYFAGSIMVGNYGHMSGGFSHTTAMSSGGLIGSIIRNELLGNE